MLDKALHLIEEYDMAPEGELVLCAVSGGADSMCLLHFLRELGRTAGFSVLAAHFDHRLRGAESDRDAAFVADWCREQGIACVTGQADVAAEARRRGGGLEETARALRYGFLEQTARDRGAGRIATAHNADDNVETMLLHLVRGTGLQGLTGIPPRRGDIVRPLLTTARAEIEEYLTRHGVPHVDDSTNSDTAFTRNRLRHEVVPVLKSLNPRLTESMTGTIRTLRADQDFLNAEAARRAGKALWAEDDLVIDTVEIAAAPTAIAPRVVRRLLEQLGDGRVQGGSAHLSAVVELARSADPSGMVNLPDGILVQRVYGEMLFTTGSDPMPPFLPVPLNAGGETLIPGSDWKVLCTIGTAEQAEGKNKDTFLLNCDMISGAVQLRPRRAGDAITLPNRDHKALKKLFIDSKVPRLRREQIPVLADEQAVLAVAGFGPDVRYLAKPGQRALKITFIPMNG